MKLSAYHEWFSLKVILLFAAFFTFPHSSHAEILCEGQYGGHLQGIAVDGESSIFWSFTVDLVKTDMTGSVVRSIEVPTHHGDLVYHDDKIYVAVNLGAFNREPGEADSWVYVYDAGDLTLLAKHEVPEAVHGAGGMTYHYGRFFVVGGLPEGYRENYVYEYDPGFRFVRRHVLASGYTRLGIQTACFAAGYFWFGCYGYPDNSALLKVDPALDIIEHYDTQASVGIDILPGGKFLLGTTGKDDESGKWWGKVKSVGLDEFKRSEVERK